MDEAKYRPYPSYKPSGIEWIGEIPDGWKVRKLKWTLSGKLKYGANETAEFDDPSLPRYIRITDFDENGSIREETFKSLPDQKAEGYYLKEGDILFARSGATVGKTFQFKDYKGIACFAGYLIKASPNNSILISDFLNYFTKSHSYESWKNAIFIQATIQNIGADKYAVFPLSLPPLSEQKAIAAFLDRETGRISGIIAKQTRLMELLKEKRSALITQAVTKGLSGLVAASDKEFEPWAKAVKYKPSGVEWIGEIPDGWKKQRFCFLFSFTKGLSITKEDLIDEGIPCINYGEIHSKYAFEVDTKKHELKSVSIDYIKSHPSSILKYGDFIFADTSEDIEGSGNFTYLNCNETAFAGYHTIITKPKQNFDFRYTAYLFDSVPFRTQIRSEVSGNKVYSITKTILKDTIVILPPLPEQIAIAAFLDRETAKIDALVGKIEKQIELLNEYKQSLITHAVTGKIDVRGDA